MLCRRRGKMVAYPKKDASVTTMSRIIFSCLFGLATMIAANAQDISSVAKVSAGTVAITAAVTVYISAGREGER